MSLNGKAKPPEKDASADWAQQVWLWPLQATRLALETYSQWFAGREPAPSSAPDRTPLAWTTPNAIALQLPSMRLRDFSRGSGGQPLVICVPYALHGALIADFAPGHSLVEALQKGGVDRVYVTDWRSAAPDMRYLSIDNYLADLNVAIDGIGGAPVDLVGLCQGGWLSILYAARFPGKVRRLVLAGSPVDVSVPSQISSMVRALPRPTFEQLVRQGDGIISGKHMLQIWSIPFNVHDVEAALQTDLGDGSEQAKSLLERFEQWDSETLDLPGTYYLEVTDWIFRENRIAERRFVALGRRIDLSAVKVPVFLLAGESDVVVPRDQAFATALLLGTPAARLQRAAEPCVHLSLFMGRRALRDSWRRVARWLQSDIDSLDARISA